MAHFLFLRRKRRNFKMSKLKKIAALLICLTMLVSILASCDEIMQGSLDVQDEADVQGNDEFEDDKENAEPEAEETEAPAEALETTPAAPIQFLSLRITPSTPAAYRERRE